MSVLTQAFLTLVRSHLVSLVLLSVRHSYKVLELVIANLGDEGLCRLESRNLVLRDHDGRVLGDIACSLLCTGLDGKAAEATEIYVLTIGQGVLYAFHEVLYYALHFDPFDTSAFSDFIYNFSLCHN